MKIDFESDDFQFLLDCWKVKISGQQRALVEMVLSIDYSWPEIERQARKCRAMQNGYRRVIFNR
jgi:hypothetical protein